MHFLSQTVSPFPLLFSTYKRNLSLLYCRIIVALCSLAVHPIIMTVCTDRPHLLTSILQPLLCVLVKLPSQDLSVSPHLSSNLILSDLSAVFDTVNHFIVDIHVFCDINLPSLNTCPHLIFLGVLAQ